MNRPALCAAALAAVFLIPPHAAQAQVIGKYVPAKLIKAGTTKHVIAGKGRVMVKVLVQPNGAHRVVQIMHSSNRADNAAARDIANSAVYAPAHRNGKPVAAFYDYVLRFTGASAVSSDAALRSGPAGHIDVLIRAGHYSAARSAALSALSANPQDPTLNEELGAADYFLARYPQAAAAFSKSASVRSEFAQVASQSYQEAAEQLASTNASLALQYAQRAVSMDGGAGSYYALGTAQLAQGNAAAAVRSLERSRNLAFAGRTSLKDRINIDTELFQAQSASGETSAAAATAAEIKRLDPASDAVQTALANQYIGQGVAASNAGSHASAIADFERAIATGVPQAVVTASVDAAFEESKLAKPDYAKMKAYADRALAIQGTQAAANFAEGVALYGEYAVAGRVDAALKSQAAAALAKARAEASAQNDTQLLQNIDNFLQQNIK